MGLKKLISSILTLLLAPKKVSTKLLAPTHSRTNTTAAAGGNVSASMQRHPPAAAECAVCLSSLKGGTGTRVLPCRHEFHGECVERWLAVPHFKNTCPICRFSMEDQCCGEFRRQQQQQDCFTEEMVIWFSSFHVAGF